MLRSMPRRVERLDAHGADLDRRPVLELLMRERDLVLLGLVVRGQAKRGSRPLGELARAASEVRVDVGLEDVGDLDALVGRERLVHVDVAPGVYDRDGARAGASDGIAELGETGILEALEQHRSSIGWVRPECIPMGGKRRAPRRRRRVPWG